MSVRPYKLINRSEQAALLSRLDAGVRRWVELYATENIEPQCALLASEETAGAVREREWWLAERSGEPVLGIGLPAEWPDALADLVLNIPVTSLDAAGMSLMRDVGTAMIEEFAAGLLRALSPGDVLCKRADAPVLDTTAAGGDLLCSCRIGTHLDVLIALRAGSALEGLTPTERKGTREPSSPAVSGLSSLAKALHSEWVTVEAIAGEAELTIEELRSLSVGDVLKLDHRINQPLQLCVRGGGAVCGGRLGTSKGHTAIQLT